MNRAEPTNRPTHPDDQQEVIDDLRFALAACWCIVPDGDYGPVLALITKAMSRHRCWPNYPAGAEHRGKLDALIKESMRNPYPQCDEQSREAWRKGWLSVRAELHGYGLALEGFPKEEYNPYEKDSEEWARWEKGYDNANLGLPSMLTELLDLGY